MMKFLELYVGSIILWVAIFFIGKVLFNNKDSKIRKLKLVLVIATFSLVLAMLNSFNSEILKGTIKTIFIYLLQCSFFKIVFNENIYKVTVAALILYLCLCASEAIVVSIASIILNLSNIPMTVLKNNVVTNFLVAIIEIIIINIFKKRLISYVKSSNSKGGINSIIIVIILITLALIGFKLPSTRWGFNIEFIISMIILISFCIVGIFLLKQKSDIQKKTSMYQQLVEYSNITNNVLEEYRVVTHEHKNQLLVIRSMLENKDKEINEYVESLLEKREGIKYKWIGQLNLLPLSGLKGLINYKILEMETLKLNKSISISKEISKLKLERMTIKQKDDLYSIMGVYLDNAIQSAKESREKEVSLEIYKEDKELVIVLANTYKGNIDLEKIDEYGYTTKGKNHGIGLHIVKSIIQNDSIFSSRKYKLDNYFVQEVKIDLKQIKK